MGILVCEQNFRDVWIRNESVRAEIGQILHTDTHPHTTAAKLVVRMALPTAPMNSSSMTRSAGCYCICRYTWPSRVKRKRYVRSMALAWVHSMQPCQQMLDITLFHDIQSTRTLQSNGLLYCSPIKISWGLHYEYGERKVWCSMQVTGTIQKTMLHGNRKCPTQWKKCLSVGSNKTSLASRQVQERQKPHYFQSLHVLLSGTSAYGHLTSKVRGVFGKIIWHQELPQRSKALVWKERHVMLWCAWLCLVHQHSGHWLDILVICYAFL